MSSKKTLIVLASGGDAPGMNSAFRAAVRCWLHKTEKEKKENIDYKVIAAKNGYNGIVIPDVTRPLSKGDVGGLLACGGTVFGAGRCENLINKGSTERKKIKKHLAGMKKELAGLIVIGGNGSYSGMKNVLFDECKVCTIGIPATIDNDIWGTDLSLGVDTALNTAIELIDKIRDTAAAFRRTFVVEVMGRNCGYLALSTAIATEAETFFLPEEKASFNMLGDMKKNLDELFENKFLDTVVIVAEGAKLKIATIENFIQTFTKWETRSVVPGYTQRGGNPSGIDRILGCRFAWKAVKELKKNQQTPYAKVVTLKKGIDITLEDNLTDIIAKSGKNSKINDIRYKKMILLQRALSSYCPPLPYSPNIGISLLVIHGPDAPGINAAIRAYTRIALKTKVGEISGFRTIAVRRGLEGLSDPKLQMNDFIDLDWGKTTGFSYSGGVPSKFSLRYNIEPIHACPRDWLKGNSITKAIAEINKNIEKFEKDKNDKGTPCKINNLVVIGGRDAIDSIEDLRSNGFHLPIIYIPASIDNNIPYTDFSIGYDTALNNAIKAIDKIKETALSEGRVFLIETMGGLSGFLPLSIGIATGVEHILIPELFTETPSLEDMNSIAKNIGKRLENEERSSRITHAIIVFHESVVEKLGGIDTITNIFAESGKKNDPPYEARPTVLGYTLRGGTPSAFDRILATCLGAEAATALEDIAGNQDIVYAAVLEDNDIKKIKLPDFNTGKRAVADNRRKLARMKELAEIHCMLSSDKWMEQKLDDIEIFSNRIVKHDRTQKFHQLWEKFWENRNRIKGNKGLSTK